MTAIYLDRAAFVAGITFFVAFILTFWPSRRISICAAILYAIGALTYLVFFAAHYFQLSVMEWKANGGLSGSFPAVGWLLPGLIVVYGVAASAVLLPFISQRKALRFGRILHLVVLPLLVVCLWVAPFHEYLSIAAHSLNWLAYGVLWFRVREGYCNLRPNKSLQATAAAPASCD